MYNKELAAALRRAGEALTQAAAILDSLPADAKEGLSLTERWIATLKRFDVTHEEGLSRAEASAAFRDNGLSPRAAGSWTRHGWIAREGDRRWLTDKGRRWIAKKEAEMAKKAA
jgi:hypothetical protein